jgi:alpha-L-fucosidase
VSVLVRNSDEPVACSTGAFSFQLIEHHRRDPKGDAVKLKPLALLPRRATLLNTGAAIPCSLDLVPSEHGDQGRYLRLGKLPVNEDANTMLVAKLGFDRLPAVLGSAKESGASVL